MFHVDGSPDFGLSINESLIKNSCFMKIFELSVVNTGLNVQLGHSFE